MNPFSVRCTVILAVLFGLSACEEGQNPFAPKPASQTAVGEARVEVKEIERPDIFSAEEKALWDGRPSLGGVWVAHPDVDQPESVIITNVETGKSIPGALFRRERNNPGPRIQVSSDAAKELGLLAGQPATVKVVVVRREEVVVEPAPLPISEETSNDAVQTESAEGTILQPGTAQDEAIAAAAVAGTAAATAPQPKKPNFFERLFGKKPKEDPTTATEIAIASDASVPEVEATALDPVTTTAAAAIAEAEAREAEPVAPTPSGGLKNPFIQVGIYSVEANANAVAANLRQAGIVPTIKSLTNSEGKTLWRVLVGPMTSANDQAEMLALVKKLGYGDSFLAPK